MRNSHHAGFALIFSTVLCFSNLAPGLSNAARAQEPEPKATTQRGIQLYEQGDFSGAAKVLEEVVQKHAQDADAWYYLGLAFHRQGLTGVTVNPFRRAIELRPDSADAHAKLSYALILANETKQAIAMAQRAIELGDQSAEPHYAIAEASLRMAREAPEAKLLEKAVEQSDAALKSDPGFSLALITRSFAQYRLKNYAEAAASLERFLALDPDDDEDGIWRAQLESLRTSDTHPFLAGPEKTAVLAPKEVTQKARVLSKPEPSYTEAARLRGVQGTVALRAVFSSDGRVKNVRVVQALPFGLTTQAIWAARQMKFTPATKDGEPVSMYIQLEYNFNLY